MTNNFSIRSINAISIVEFLKETTVDECKTIIAYLAKENWYHLRLWDLCSIEF